MTNSRENTSLRQDLEIIGVEDGHDRFRIIACDISGVFTRVTVDAWKRLSGQSSSGSEDATLWALAGQAGWTRQRMGTNRRRLSPLAIQIPLVRIDHFAAWLAARSDWLFSQKSMAFWVCVFGLAMVAVLSRWKQLLSDLAELPGFLMTCPPFGLFLILAATKLLHELGHAVMCRRVGVKCGDLGIMLFCGIPCPYCDVTQVWRERSSRSRMAVMFAGIYVEWILTSFAVLVWCLADDAILRMYAVNVMVLCGISTLVFNANPLMRYDGYYVLADWVASPDLRHEARTAFRSGLQRVLQAPSRSIQSVKVGRSMGLSVYHVASFVYRIVVLVAIAGFIVWIGDWLGFRMAGRVLVITSVLTMGFAARRSMFGMIAGRGEWHEVNRFRRWGLAVLVTLVLAGFALVPTPRFRTVRGTLDVGDATSVYLPRASRLIKAKTDFGDHVTEGQLLATTESIETETSQIRTRTRAKLASMQTVLARHRMVSGLGDDRDWTTYETAKRAASAAAADAEQRMKDLNVTAQRAGVVVPFSVGRESKRESRRTVKSLVQTEGTVRDDGVAWCRIADPNQLDIVFVVDSELRRAVHPGGMIDVTIATQPGRRYVADIESIAESDLTSSESWQSSTFQLRCRLRDPGGLNVLANLGASCTAVVDLPRRSVAQDMVDSLAWWIYE